jgi:hypothetical protein
VLSDPINSGEALHCPLFTCNVKVEDAKKKKVKMKMKDKRS